MSGSFSLSCPVPPSRYDQVLMAHGGGGTLMARLLAEVFFPAFANPLLEEEHDGALLTLPNGTRLAFSTDSYVVQPLFFPGGDIGSLAVNGTVNDLAMCGARPLCLSAGFIIEEGLPMIRAANTGISAVIDAYGNVLASLDMQREGIIDHVLPAARAATPYARWGDATLLAVLAGLGFVIVWRPRKRGRGGG